MIDIHAHILPGMDDGAASWEDAIEMAQIAAAADTRIIAAVCHANLPAEKRMEEENTLHNKQIKKNEAGTVRNSMGTETVWTQKRITHYRTQLETFRRMLEEEKIPLTVAEGMEIFADSNIVQKLKQGELLTLNKTRYVLIEFAPDTQAHFIYQITDRLMENGYFPVLAHPERYLCAQRTPVHLREWYEMGTVLQINKGSVLGRFGAGAEDTADYMLRRGLALAAASDAHSPFHRTPAMRQFYETLERRYGSDCAWLLLKENPARILSGKKIDF